MSPRFKARQEEENKEDINQDEVVERSSRSAEKKRTHAHSNFLSKLQGRMASIRQATQSNACSAPASPAKPLPPGSTSSPTASKKRSSPPTQSRAPQPSASPYLNRNPPMPGGALSAAPAPSPPRLAVAPRTTASSTRSPSPTAAASSAAAAAAAAAPAAAPAAAAAAAAVPPHPAFLSQHLPTRSSSGSLAQPLHQVPSHIQQDQPQPLQSTMTYQPHSLPSAPPSPSFTPTPSPSASMSSFKGGTNSSASPNKARTRSSPTPATPLSLLSAQERRRRRQDLLTAEALSAARHSTASLRSPSPCLAPGSVQQDGEARGYPQLLHYYEDHGKSNSPASHHHHHHHHRHHHHQQQQQPLQHWQQPGAAAADAAAAAAQLAAPGSHISPPHGIVGLRSVGSHSNGRGDALASASKHKRTSPPQQHSPHPHALPTVADLPPSPLAAPQLPPSYTEVQPPSKPGDNVLTLPTNALDSGPCSCGSPGSGAGWAVSPTPSCSSTPRSMAQAGEITVPPAGSGSSSPGSQVDTKRSHQSKCMSARPSSCSPDSPGSAKGSRRRRRRRSSSTRPSEGRQKRRRPSSSRQHRNRRPTSSSSSPDPDGASPLACSPAGTTSTSSAPAVNPRAVLWVPPASPFSLLEEVLYEDPWKLMVACMLLNKTSSTQVRLILGRLFALYPTPESLAALYQPPVRTKPKPASKKSTLRRATSRAVADLSAPSTAAAQERPPLVSEASLPPAPAAAAAGAGAGGNDGWGGDKCAVAVPRPPQSPTPQAAAAPAAAIIGTAFTPPSSSSPVPVAETAARADTTPAAAQQQVQRAAQQQVQQEEQQQQKAAQQQVEQAAQQQVQQATQQQAQQATQQQAQQAAQQQAQGAAQGQVQQAAQAAVQGSPAASAPACSSSPSPTTPPAFPSPSPSYSTSPAALHSPSSHPQTTVQLPPCSSAAAAGAGATVGEAISAGAAPPAVRAAAEAAGAAAGAVDGLPEVLAAPPAAGTETNAAGTAAAGADVGTGPSPARQAGDALAQLQQLLRPLGLFRKRAVMLARFSYEYLHVPWTDPQELHGIGQYAADAYWMFCRGRWQQVDPADKDLRRYRDWLQQTGGEGAGLQRESLSEVLAAPAGASKTDHS